MARKQPPKRTPVECVALDLPKPISVNRLWGAKKGGGFYARDDYKAWKEEVGLQINAQRAGAVLGPYALTIWVSTKWRGDLGNAEKGVSDVLQENGVIQNDRLAQRILTEWSADSEIIGMRVLVVATKEVA